MMPEAFTKLLAALLVAAVTSSTSTNQSPVVSFTTPGTKTVTLKACNSAGCSTVTKTVIVLDPSPRILAISGPTALSPSTAGTYSASVTGRPPYSYSWRLTRPDSSQLTGTNPTFTWTPATAGSYQLSLSLFNLSGSATASLPITVAASVFADVPANYWARSFIEILYYTGFTAGCAYDSSTGIRLFCPENNVTRGELAVYVGRALHPPPFVPPPATGLVYADVAASNSAAPWIEQLHRDGVATGCDATHYCPSNPATRADTALLIVRSSHGLAFNPPPATGIFQDVPTTDPNARWIEQFFHDGITGGCSTTPHLFCPLGPLTRAQLAVFLVTAYHLAAVPTPTTFLATLCSAASCTYPSGMPLSFSVRLQGGSPSSYSYDWNGDGTYEETVTYPVSHVYTTAGTYTPRLRLNAGSSSTVITHPFPIRITTASGLLAPPASIGATAVALVPPAPTDPPGTPLRVAYAVSASPQTALAGYAAYVNPGTGSGYVFVTLLQPNRSLATDQLLFPPGTPGIPRYLYLRPFTPQTFGTASLPVQLP
jgi:PKD repeat protein